MIGSEYAICVDVEEQESLLQLEEAFAPLSTPSANDIRKAFFPLLTETLGCKPKNAGGGVWDFSVIINNKAMELSVDFGGFSTFRYHIDVFPDQKHQNIKWISYEKILGFSEQNWDLMRTDLLDQHAEVFVEVVKRTLHALAITVEG